MWLVTPSSAAAAQPDDRAAHLQELRALGVSQAQIDAAAREEAAAPGDDDELALWAWHIDALRLFAAMQTQWQVVAAGVGLLYMGLRYEALDAVCSRLGLARDDELLFRQLRTMERAGARHLNQASEGLKR